MARSRVLSCSKLPDVARRTMLQQLAAGAICLPGLRLTASLFGATPDAASPVRRMAKARSIIFVSLFGGPPHQDTFDLKESAPSEIRGEFQSIATSLDGFRICEYLPKLAQLAHLYTIIRSVTHEDNAHESAFYSLMTGWPHPQPNTNARPTAADYPNYGVVLEQICPPKNPVPGFVLGGGLTSGGIGQTAGFLDRSRAPFLLPQDANHPQFAVPEFTFSADSSLARLSKRRTLVEQFDEFASLSEVKPAEQFSTLQSRAFEMLAANRLSEAFDISRESVECREAYGRNPFGQNLLVARRLVEAGVPIVQVNWRNKGDGGLDTHYDNFNQCKGVLLPRLDACLSSLLIDLNQRGLLDQTLVIAAGEFGRTPKINDLAGRDHWAGCNSVLMAGGGIRAGFVFGSSDRIGAYPATSPVGPWDLHATMLDRYGVELDGVIHDSTGRPHPICKGTPIAAVLDDSMRESESRRAVGAAIYPAPVAAIHLPDEQVLQTLYRSRLNAIDGATLMYVPGGPFIMGSDSFSNEAPPHPVEVQSFWMSRTHVTNAMYRAFVATTGHRTQEFYNQHLMGSALFYADEQPAVGVSFDDAVAYCRWAGGRLPTEAEWEFAARGVDGREYPWGNEFPTPSHAVYGRTVGHGGSSATVGSVRSDCSPFGLVDMAGNVMEWCADWYAPYASNSVLQTDPKGPAQGVNRVVRGGCWAYESRSLRTTERLQQPPQQRLNLIGFRVVMDT